MMPELTAAFGLTTLGIGSLVGLYYYTYASFAIVAGATLDRYGAKLPIFIGVMTTALGSVLFGLGSIGAAESGRLLQGAGSAFAFTREPSILRSTVFLRAGSRPPSGLLNLLECSAGLPDSLRSGLWYMDNLAGSHCGSMQGARWR